MCNNVYVYLRAGVNNYLPHCSSQVGNRRSFRFAERYLDQHGGAVGCDMVGGVPSPSVAGFGLQGQT